MKNCTLKRIDDSGDSDVFRAFSTPEQNPTLNISSAHPDAMQREPLGGRSLKLMALDGPAKNGKHG